MATIINQEEENNKDNTQSVDQSVVAKTGGLTGSVSPTQAQSQVASSPKGSGRFTNLQKYLDTNQGAGQKIADQVSSKVQENVSQQQNTANSYNQSIKEGIDSAKTALQSGGTYLNQLKNIGETGEGLQSFTSDPNYSNFQNIQAGRGLNEDLLNQQQDQLYSASQDYLESAQNALSDVGTESGRFDLLRETFGGASRPGYSTGQQRLDQLFLAKQGLAPLQQTLKQNVDEAQSLSNQAYKAGLDINNLTSQESDLMSSIGSEASRISDDYTSYLNDILAARQAESDSLSSGLREGLTSGSLTSDQLSQLGLSSGTNIYDINLADYANTVPDRDWETRR
jgi:hypothetical protein